MRVLVADDHDMVREMIAAFLQGGDIDEVKTAATLDDALRLVRGNGGFDLVLLDYRMPGMNGLEGLARMIAGNAPNPVAILSGAASREIADAALRSGARGFIPKTLGASALLNAARSIVAGEIYAPLHELDDQPPPDGTALSKREIEVLRGICEGKSNKEIAREYDLQEVTIKLHVKTLSRKLEARNRTHAAMIARDRGLV